MFGEEEEGLFGVFVGFEGEEVCFELEEGEELGEGEEVADVGDEGGVCVEVGEAVVEELFFPGVEAEVMKEAVELVYFGGGGGDEGLTCGGLEGEGGGVLRGWRRR